MIDDKQISRVVACFEGGNGVLRADERKVGVDEQ